jgi:hypothetical protein
MNGIRIHEKLRFAQLFSTVLERLAGSIWITESKAFLYPDEWYEGSTFDVALDRYVGGIIGEFERGALEITDPQQSENSSILGHIGEIDHLARFANAVREDWNLIVVLPNRPADPGAWFRASWQAASRPVYFETHCIAVFCNIDAAYWEFYSNREDLLPELQSHLDRIAVGYEQARLSDSYGI